MLIEGQKVTIRINNKNQEHYIQLGYDVKFGDQIIVPTEHLLPCSTAIVKVKCDIDGCDTIMEKQYGTYLQQHTHNMDVCKEHKTEKAKLSNLKKYGTEWGFQNEEVKKKIDTTNIERYGYKNPSSSPEIRKRVRQTVLNKYGVECSLQALEIQDKIKQTIRDKYGVEFYFQSDDYKEKYQQVCLDKYGVTNVFASEEIKEKIYQTNIKKYGAKSPMQNPNVKAKAMMTLLQNGDVPTSSQQLQLYKMIQEKYPDAELNYPFSSCVLDIFVCINNVQIDIEYDGNHWHKNQQRDIRRDKFLQSQGLKTLRIRSGHLLPEIDELFNAIDYLVNTDRRFKEIILSDWEDGEIDESLFNSTAV